MKLEVGEEMIVTIRKHWLVFAGDLFLVILGAALPLIGLMLLPQGVFSALPADVGGPIITFLYLVWLLFLWLLLFIFWTNYYLDIWIITNQHIIDIEQRGLFSREIKMGHIEKIEDVTIDMEGVLQTLFDFGTLTVRTAAEDTGLVLTNAANPNRARDLIFDVQKHMHDHDYPRTLGSSADEE